MYKTVKQVFMAAFLVVSAQAAVAEGNPEAGKAKTLVCAACHGADGNSPAPNFPKLAGLGEKYLYKQLTDIKEGRRNVLEMTGMLTSMSDQDLKDIAAYFDSQTIQLSGAKPLKVLTNSGQEVDALALGEKVFRAGNKKTSVAACMGCHSPTGQGNDPAGFPRLSGQHPEYIEKQLRAFRAGERTNDGEQSTMRQVAANLSDAELKAVANFVAGLN